MINSFEEKIKRLVGFAFQDFIDELFILRFGNNYQPTYKYRDKGCDGILFNEQVIAAYAPQEYSLESFKKKAIDDHKKYERFWIKKLPKWCFVFNGEFRADMHKFIDDLHKNSDKIGIKEILNFIRDLTYPHRKKLVDKLGIDKQYLSTDVLQNVIEDMLRVKMVQIDLSSIQIKPPDHMPDKIELNYDEADIEGIIRQYENFLSRMPYLKDLLKIYDDSEVFTLKANIIRMFHKLQGDFKSKFETLTEIFAGVRKNDEVYVEHVRLVLFYCFEICIIGKRTEKENIKSLM